MCRSMSDLNVYECTPHKHIKLKNAPPLDSGFMPLGLYMDEFLKDAHEPVNIAFERENGNITLFKTFIHKKADKNVDFSEYMHSEDAFYIERVVKFMLWGAGAFRIYVCGCDNAARHIASLYKDGGARSFDRETMERIYERPFEVVSCALDKTPEPFERAPCKSGSASGARIGLDVGCSNIKVCAMSDGNIVYTNTHAWSPSDMADPEYHISALLNALCGAWNAIQATAKAAGRPIISIGISTAGVFVNNKARISSLFRSVPEDSFASKIYSIYPDVCDAFKNRTGCDAVFSIINDGDAAALCAALSHRMSDVLGISMGTSEAGGYIDADGNITGRLNELAFTPVDMNAAMLRDEHSRDSWSGDFGCGVKYLSSEAVTRLATAAGIHLEEAAIQDNVRRVQELAGAKDKRALAVFETIGCYLAHSIYTYYKFYSMRHTAVMGGVSAGPGGAVLLKKCNEVLLSEYPMLKTDIITPSGDSRTYGQSFAAATLA